jgi:site-specific recombinase XerD
MAQQAKPAHYNLKLVYLKAFFNWCLQEGIISENPLLQFKKRKDEGRVVNLATDVLSQLIALPDKNTFTGLRDYALLLLTLDTGIRPKEAFYLLPTDINLHALEVYVRAENAKTRISRTLPVMPVSAKVLRELISARHPSWDNSMPVFCTQDGIVLNRYSWRSRMEGYSKRLGVKIRPYDLRHAFALQFLRNGGNALVLQRILGHSDLTMTRRYVALTQDDLKEQHALASPLNVLVPQRQRVRKGI